MTSKVDFAEAQIIYSVGDDASGAYIIVSGYVDLYSKNGIRLATLGEGEIFGELGQLMSRSRSVTAKARSKCSATFIPKDVLLEKFENSDTAIQGIFRAVAVRLKKSNQELETLYEKFDKLQSDNAKLHGEVAKLKRSL
jgi:CRP/FNR family transcriptional regulator, cyclic AMP receptor protein